MELYNSSSIQFQHPCSLIRNSVKLGGFLPLLFRILLSTALSQTELEGTYLVRSTPGAVQVTDCCCHVLSSLFLPSPGVQARAVAEGCAEQCGRANKLTPAAELSQGVNLPRFQWCSEQRWTLSSLWWILQFFYFRWIGHEENENFGFPLLNGFESFFVNNFWVGSPGGQWGCVFFSLFCVC